MCYYNGIKVSREEFIRLKELEIRVRPLFRPAQSGFDYNDWPIVKPIYNGVGLDMIPAHWELVPKWIKNATELAASRKKYTTLNAKAETLLTSNMFKESALKRRCLVLSSGFFEFRHYTPEGNKIAKKYPYYIRAKENRDFFFMAGIWQPWLDPFTNIIIDTFAIVTRAAPETHLMASIHNDKKRMPVIFNDEMAYEWLRTDLTEAEIQAVANYEYPTEMLEAYTVASKFTKQKEPLKPYFHPELPPLVGFDNSVLYQQLEKFKLQLGMFDTLS